MFVHWEHDQVVKCPLTRGVNLQEVSVSGGTTVLYINAISERHCESIILVSCPRRPGPLDPESNSLTIY